MTNKQMKSSCCGANLNILVKKPEELPNTVNVYGCSKCRNITDDSCLNPQEEKTNKDKILEDFRKEFTDSDGRWEHSDTCGEAQGFISNVLDSYAEYTLNQFKAELREKIEERINEYDSRMQKFAIEEDNKESDEEKESCDYYFNQYHNRKMALKGVIVDFLLSPDQVDNS